MTSMERLYLRGEKRRNRVFFDPLFAKFKIFFYL